MFEHLFTTYLATIPPPIITEDYKKIKDFYDYYNAVIDEENIQPTAKFSIKDFYPNNPFEIKTDAPEIIDTPVIFDKSSDGELAVDIARQFLGTKYSWGGMSPSTGFDCSGLVKYAYNQVGIDLPRTAKQMSTEGIKINSLDDVQIGDLVFSSSSSGNHVEMVSKIQDGLIYTIEAKGKKLGIIESPLKKTKNITIRRVSSEPFSKKEFVKTMYFYLYNALENNGLDGKTWAPILVALTSIESNWGNEFSRRNNNFAGIKGEGETISTKEYSPSRGYYTIKDSFKSFSSISDFADYFVKRLKTKFKAFNGTPQLYVSNIKKHGYFTAPLARYLNMMNSRLQSINKLLNS